MAQKVFLLTFQADGAPDCARPASVSDDYVGDPYGPGVPFTVGSNQTIVTRFQALWGWCAGYCKGASDYDHGKTRGEWEGTSDGSEGL